MKKILCTALCSLFALFAMQTVQAQNFSLGAKVGLNYSQLKMDNLKANIGTVTTTFQQNTQFATGFLLGGFAKIKFNSFYVQPELYFSMKGGSFDKIKAQGGINGTTLLTEQYDVQTTGFDVPILLGYQAGFFRFNLGPVASFNMSSLDGFKTAIEVQGTTTASNDAVKSAIWGYQVGIGADISKFTLDLRYEGNFSSLTSAGIGTASTSFGTLSQKTALFQFSVGYKFM
jgi:hypothetical protein